MNAFRPPGPNSLSRIQSQLFRGLRALLAVVLLSTSLILPDQQASATPHMPQANTPEGKAQALLDRLTPEERVGQLFLVTFSGMVYDENTPIYDLIVNYNIGGVILLTENDNFIDGQDALTSVVTMNRQLQLHRWLTSQQPQVDPVTNEEINRHFVPLFIGAITPETGGNFDRTLVDGLTPLPNQLAIGATWDPGLAEAVGAVQGEELAALGINFLLGPSLDVLESPQPTTQSDLGTRTFGGDPFWVGQMGKAYIRGLHQGSEGQLAVVAKHFPGNGGADRSPEQEVATVRKSLDELKNFDLAPFFAVTGQAPNPASTVDALLASHIRYQGFQENIRATTRPVSFDPQAFNLLLGLPNLATWREAGGLMVSDNLGSQAVRGFYKLTGQEYEARRVALNAFLAGNDLLFLGDISTRAEGNAEVTEDVDKFSATVRTLDFFAQKYREDPAFAQRVDESVRRILILKYRLYPSFNLATTLPPIEGVRQLGNENQIAFQVARQAATLISPSLAELDEAIPDPPNRNDRIVFITDTRTVSACGSCPEQTVLEPEAFQQAVLRLYGPQAGGLVLSNYITAYDYSDLEVMLNDERNDPQIRYDIQRAHWVVFAMLNIDSNVTASRALVRFLSERPDLFQQKRLIVFSFDAPYYLDATNISKITAYYALYSPITSFIDVAARLLFREIRPSGAPPVSVPGVGYDLISATAPDPNQTIPLFLINPSTGEPYHSDTGTPGAFPEFRVGNLINVRTGTILDHNGHPVPDGTPVQFVLTVNGEANSSLQSNTTTNGVAETTVQVPESATLELRAESEPAKQSTILRFEIPAEVLPAETVTPTQPPTSTPEPSPTPTEVSAPAVTTEPTPPLRPGLVDWFMAMLVAIIISMVTYRLSAWAGQVRWGVRSGFLALIGGLLAYILLTLQLPLSESLLDNYGSWAVLLTTLIGSIIGIILTWVWRKIYTRNHKLISSTS